MADFYPAVIEKAQEIHNTGKWGKGKVSSIISELEHKQEMMEDNLRGKTHMLEMGQKIIKQMTEPIEILYLSDSSARDCVFVKR